MKKELLWDTFKGLVLWAIISLIAGYFLVTEVAPAVRETIVRETHTIIQEAVVPALPQSLEFCNASGCTTVELIY